MTSYGGTEPTSSRATRGDVPPSGTTAGADMTARMSGSDRTDRDRLHTTDGHRGDHERVERTDDSREVRTSYGHQAPGKLKTSAAAVFALVFGLAALFCALTAILAPAAVLFGIIGIILAIAGMKMAKRPNVTGKGVAIGGLVTALLGLLLGGAVLGGIAAIVNDERRLDQLQTQLDKLRNDLPTGAEVREQVS